MSMPYNPYPPYPMHPQDPGGQAVWMAHSGYPTAGDHRPVYGSAPYFSPPGYMPGGVYPGAYQGQQSPPLFNFTNDRFLKGLLIGSAVTYFLTNDAMQRTAIKGVVAAWRLVQGGVEEIKERFHDAEAELQAAGAEDTETGEAQPAAES